LPRDTVAARLRAVTGVELKLGTTRAGLQLKNRRELFGLKPYELVSGGYERVIFIPICIPSVSRIMRAIIKFDDANYRKV
jgi:hypothetical protein